VKLIRPKPFTEIFDLAHAGAARKDWLQPYALKTALLITVSKFPFRRTWLRLWLSPYLLDPNDSAFVFLVEDWLALSQQIDDRRVAWEKRRLAQQAPYETGFARR
jgi:hypothetical protein